MMMRAILACLTILVPLVSATGVRVKTIDEGGSPYSNILIIVRSLNTNLEEGRFLTDIRGEIPQIQLDKGLHQVIATCPYGLCKTIAREFLIEAQSKALILAVPYKGTDELGELVGARTITLVFQPSKAGGQTTAGLSLFVRDDAGVRQTWYKVHADDKVTVQLIGNPTHIVLKAADTIYQYDLRDKCVPSYNDDPALTCLVVEPGATEATIPSR